MIGSVVMTRPSARGWRGTVKPYCGYHLLPMRPAKRSPRGSARCRWCAIAATTTRCRPHTDIARYWSAVMKLGLVETLFSIQHCVTCHTDLDVIAHDFIIFHRWTQG